MLGGSCVSTDVFQCHSDAECNTADQAGICEENGFCAFPNDECPSEYAYGELAGPELAGQCVPLSTSSSTGVDTPPMGDTTHSTTDPSTTDALTSTSGASTTGAGARVTDGLLVLYTFDEGSGTVVLDHGAPPVVDLVIPGDASVTWGPEGLTVTADGTAIDSGPALKVHDACSASGAFTAEAWVTPSNAVQGSLSSGPAKILSHATSPSTRNFTLGIGHLDDGPSGQLAFAVRTSTTDTDAYPYLYTGSDVVMTAPMHVVATYTTGDADRMYVDGIEVAVGPKADDLSTWNDMATIAIGSGGPSFLGTYHLVAVYDHALSSTEIQQNFDAGY